MALNCLMGANHAFHRGLPHVNILNNISIQGSKKHQTNNGHHPFFRRKTDQNAPNNRTNSVSHQKPALPNPPPKKQQQQHSKKIGEQKSHPKTIQQKFNKTCQNTERSVFTRISPGGARWPSTSCTPITAPDPAAVSSRERRGSLLGHGFDPGTPKVFDRKRCWNMRTPFQTQNH